MYPGEITTSLRPHELKPMEGRTVAAHDGGHEQTTLHIVISIAIALSALFIFYATEAQMKLYALVLSVLFFLGHLLTYWRIHRAAIHLSIWQEWLGYILQLLLLLGAPFLLTSEVPFWLLAVPIHATAPTLMRPTKKALGITVIFTIASTLGQGFAGATWLSTLLPFLVLLCTGVTSFFVHANLGPISVQLQSALSHLNLETAKRRQLEQQLEKMHHELEHRMEERMIALVRTNQALQREVQDRRSAENKALEASRIKSSFLANMSHELRTPLNAIIGYTEILLEENKEATSTSIRPDLQNIQHAAANLLAIVNDILDLSKIEAGKMDIRVETFKVADLIENVANTLAPLVRKNHNTLKLKYSKQLGTIRTDRTKLHQILANLLSNACKFTEHGKIELLVETVIEDGRIWYVFSVSDTGIGIAPENLERLFSPFTQADDSPTRRYGGTGLGLALSQHFCHMLGGDISAESTLGKGSIFRVRMAAEPFDPRSTGLVMESLY